jgi:hypothetical protein
MPARNLGIRSRKNLSRPHLDLVMTRRERETKKKNSVSGRQSISGESLPSDGISGVTGFNSESNLPPDPMPSTKPEERADNRSCSLV